MQRVREEYNRRKSEIGSIRILSGHGYYEWQAPANPMY